MLIMFLLFDIIELPERVSMDEMEADMQFYGRERELEILEQTNHTDQFECTVLYGRRRIGKTLLLRKFMEDKDALYFMALQTGEKMNLECLSEVFNQYNKDSSGRLYPSFSSVFDELTRLAKNRRFVFVIDEFPYLAENYPVISSLLQKYIDHEWKETRLHLILCGSSMSFMEKQILGAKSPLYGRRISQIKF
ncbi:MAG: ATP-binding protein, partial [Bacillota bacterium]|nr:ATP-binding protein [Bacillota bacterium]